MAKRKTHKQFIDELTIKNIHFREGRFKVEGEYVGKRVKILTSNKYGKCLSNITSLLAGNMITIITAVDKHNYFINQCREKHSGKYKYDLVKYNGIHNNIKIECKDHGVFKQTPKNHLCGAGCPKCGTLVGSKKLRTTQTDFIKKAINKHGHKYSYEKTIYTVAAEKINIICHIHGLFTQSAADHLSGHGCTECGKENGGWSHSSWIKKARESNHFDSFKVYIIKCWNEDEEFYKIGKTFNTLTIRFKKGNNTKMPYNYSIVKVIKDDKDAIKISKLENRLQRDNKEHKYMPKIEFRGMYECFSVVNSIIR